MRYPVIKEKYSGTIRIVEKELFNLGSGRTIFVAAQNDLFAEAVPTEYIRRIIEHCEKSPGNTYLFQSKNPIRMFRYIPKTLDAVVCTTIESNRWYPKIMNNSPYPIIRAMDMGLLHNQGYKTYVTVEPILDFDLEELISLIKKCNPIQVNIGADSGGNNLPEPSREKVDALIAELSKFTTISQKRNLERLTKENANASL